MDTTTSSSGGSSSSSSSSSNDDDSINNSNNDKPEEYTGQVQNEVTTENTHTKALITNKCTKRIL
jgi:hypothetical protein